MNRYARKFIILPIMPRALEPAISGCIFQILPTGAARLVTKAIIPKRKIIVIMAMILPFPLVLDIVFVFIRFNLNY